MHAIQFVEKGRAVLAELPVADLPPGHALVTLAGPFARGIVVDPNALVWPVTFGAICLTAALLLLRRRPFGT